MTCRVPNTPDYTAVIRLACEYHSAKTGLAIDWEWVADNVKAQRTPRDRERAISIIERAISEAEMAARKAAFMRGVEA